MTGAHRLSIRSVTGADAGIRVRSRCAVWQAKAGIRFPCGPRILHP